MKILIVEDEELAIEKLTYTIAQIEKEAEVIASTTSIRSSVEWLRNNAHPDIILMDIELSDGQSFEIFNQVEVKSKIIFTTSYDEYAIKAFKVNSIDYLLKPIQKNDLKTAFDKYKKLQQEQVAARKPDMIQTLLKELQKQLLPKEYRKRFLVKSGLQHSAIEVEDIAYFFVEDKVICFKTIDRKKYIVEYSLEELEQMLDPDRFFRINRSFIVSVESIDILQEYFNSRYILKLSPPTDKAVIVSREKVSDFKKWMGR